MTDLTLTPEMIDAINRVAERHHVMPKTVLLRMVFSYAAKMDRPAVETDTANVVAIRGGRE